MHPEDAIPFEIGFMETDRLVQQYDRTRQAIRLICFVSQCTGSPIVRMQIESPVQGDYSFRFIILFSHCKHFSEGKYRRRRIKSE